MKKSIICSIILVQMFLVAAVANSKTIGEVISQQDRLAVRNQLEKDAPIRLTVAEWNSYDESAELRFIQGVFYGVTAAKWLVSDEHFTVKPERAYLLKGWRMPVSAYKLEVSVNMKQNKNCSFLGAFMRAEAEFAKAAGQVQRALRLRLEADDIDGYCSNIKGDNLPAGIKTQRKEYAEYQRQGFDGTFITGVLVGIDLVQSRVTTNVQDNELPFRVGQIASEMDVLACNTPTESSVTLLLNDAVVSLLKQASGETVSK